MKGTEELQRSWFYRPALGFLKYLDGLVDADLFSCSSETGFEQVKRAMFSDLTDYWRGLSSARETHLVHDVWGPRVIGMSMRKRSSVCVYHEVACGSSMLRDTLKKKGICNGLCRHGCDKRETMDHVLWECDRYKGFRGQLSIICEENKIEMTTAKIMTDMRLQPILEEWFSTIGLYKYKGI